VSAKSTPLEGDIPMTMKTRPSLPKGKPKNGISQWDNEGGAPSSGDRSRKQGGRTEKPEKPAKKAS
jgi:hypothetical protein